MKTQITSTGVEFIQFKCPGHKGDDDKFQKSVMRVVNKKSKEFTGVAIGNAFLRPNGNFNLYGEHTFQNEEGVQYTWTGIDTENWRGFSIRIYRK